MSRFERWFVWITTGGTLATGLVYWWMKDILEPADPWAVINHPLQPWVLKGHILIAPLLVFAVGLIASRHIWRHYRLGVRKGRRSGLLAASTFGLMVLSGYLIQVLTAETVVRLLGWTHLTLGVVFSAGVAVHRPATNGRQEPEERDRARDAPTGAGRARPEADRATRIAGPA